MSVDHWMLSRNVVFISKPQKIIHLSSTTSNTFLLQFNKDIQSTVNIDIDLYKETFAKHESTRVDLPNRQQLINERHSLPNVRIEIASTFKYLPLFTQINQSGKFAYLSNDLKRIHICQFNKKLKDLHVLSGHTQNVTVLHSFQTLDNEIKYGYCNHKIRINALASGSKDGSIRIWNVKNGQCLQLILGLDRNVSIRSWIQLISAN